MNLNMMFWSKAVLFLLYMNLIKTKRILAIFPFPSISHQVVFRPLTQELARRGHEVVVITTDPAFPKGETPANLTEIDVHDISYKIWREYVPELAATDDITTQLKIANDIYAALFKEQMNNNDVNFLKQDKANKFDLLLLEACVRVALGWSHVFNVPVIQISSFGAMFLNLYTIGAPFHPIIYPSPVNRNLYNPTMFEKIKQLFFQLNLETIFRKYEVKENELLQKVFGPDVPRKSELSNNVDMLYLNMHPIWEGNHPVPPGVVYMGGMHQKPQQKLPEELELFLNSSRHGVIYMSFGSNISPSSLPKEVIQKFLNVFSQLPYDILWKWDKDELPGQVNNIRIGKWFPQSDLLKHPKLKLFITHGGLQSTEEAIMSEVPLVGIPVFGDQWYNVEKYVYHKIGIQLDLQTLTEEQLRNGINTVIGNESYRNNIKKLKTIMNDQPQSALQRAVWWTEYVLRHGGARQLRAPAANISWGEYLEIELVLTLLGILLLVLCLIIGMIYSFCRCIKNKLPKDKVL